MGSVATVAALDDAVARIGRRFGSRALVRGASLERRADEGVLRTGTAFDRTFATPVACRRSRMRRA